ncbi:unnamed protein product [Adineta ricciae]|uniref:BAH domain-containing protein n=1 Tax=Adineta ricciae TaxID=249248 RepID=A0A814EUI3_ADIRI|nr:unnamed protein product [Adineta ricciae]
MIPQIQQLLPLETNVSGSWLNTHFPSESLVTATNKLLSPPISITPTSICTDLSESDYQPVDLSSTALRKYSLSSPPLSNLNSESVDLIDSLMAPSNPEKQQFLSASRSVHKTSKQCSNFSIEHILSSSFRSPTYELLSIGCRHIPSIFSKTKLRHFSDHYLHRILHRRKRPKHGYVSSSSHDSQQPQGTLLQHIFDFYNDLVKRQNQIGKSENFCTIDALGQLAEIACKLDTRQTRSLLNENSLTSKNYDLLLGQCHRMIQQIDRKYQKKKILKRSYRNLRLTNEEKHFIQLDELSFLTPNQITPNLDILIPNDGFLYEATIQPVDNYDDLLLVRLHHERQTYLIPIHDLCRLACPKMIPKDFQSLSKGLRVCAFWSTSLRGLHPATIDKIPSEIDESSTVGLIFDDGDIGLIKLHEIRLLPDDYDIKGINLDEWRITSYQLPSTPSSRSSSSSRRTSRRVSSNVSNSTTGSVKRLRPVRTSPIKVPPWTLNVRNSTIRRHDNKETIRVGDCIVLHGIDTSLSYIGKVLGFYHNKSTEQDMVKIQWYYSPRETPKGVRKADLTGALYESTHIDENPIASIKYKGTIYKSYDDYVKATDYGKRRGEADFYLVGHYNPTSGTLKRYDGQ